MEDLRLSQLCPSKYLSGDELDQPEILTIDTIEFEEMFNPGDKRTQEKPVLYAKDHSRGIILGPERIADLAEIFGDLTIKELVGKVVELYVEKNRKVGPNTFNILRFRKPSEPKPKPELPKGLTPEQTQFANDVEALFPDDQPEDIAACILSAGKVVFGAEFDGAWRKLTEIGQLQDLMSQLRKDKATADLNGLPF